MDCTNHIIDFGCPDNRVARGLDKKGSTVLFTLGATIGDNPSTTILMVPSRRLLLYFCWLCMYNHTIIPYICCSICYTFLSLHDFLKKNL